jgi:hypothetical protein
MKVKARKLVILVSLRATFNIGRVINGTNVSPSDQSFLILDPKYLNLTDNYIV